MRRVTAALLFAAAIGQFGLAAATPAMAQPRAATDLRAQRRATAESIAAQYAAEQFRTNRIGDENTRKLLAENEANRRRIAAVLKDARTSKAERDAARAQLAVLDTQLEEVNAKLLASEQTSDELRAQLREYTRQISSAVEEASPEVAAAYELYAQGDRDTAYEVIDRLSQVEAAAARRAGEIRAGALLRRPATLAMDRVDRGEMTKAQAAAAWERAQAGDPSYMRGWVELANLRIDSGRLVDAQAAARSALLASTTDSERGLATALIGDTMITAGDVTGGSAEFVKALEFLEKAVKADANDLLSQRTMMAIYDRLGDVRATERDFRESGNAYGASLVIARRLVAAQPENIRGQRDLAVALAKVGDAYMQAENVPAAKASYEELLALARKTSAQFPENLNYQRDVGLALVKLGEFHDDIGEDARGRALIQESLVIARRLAAVDATNAVTRRDLSVVLEKLADLTDAKGPGLARYRALMDESIQIRRELAAADPANAAAQLDLAYGFDSYAQVLAQQGDPAGARKALEESLAISRRLAASRTSYGFDQRRLGLSLMQLGLVVEEIDPAAAKPLFEEMLSIRRALAEQNPNSILAGKELGTALLVHGDLRAKARDWPAALAYYKEALALLLRLQPLDNQDRTLFRNLGVAFRSVGDASYELRDTASVRENYDLALRVFDDLLKATPDDPVAHRDLWASLWSWASMTNNAEAWNQAIQYMEAADKRGFLNPADKAELVRARTFAKEAEAAARAAPPSGAPSVTPSGARQ